MASAVVLMCCAHSVDKCCGIKIAEDVCIALLRMMALTPDGGGYDFIRSLMKEKESLYVIMTYN